MEADEQDGQGKKIRQAHGPKVVHPGEKAGSAPRRPGRGFQELPILKGSAPGSHPPTSIETFPTNFAPPLAAGLRGRESGRPPPRRKKSFFPAAQTPPAAPAGDRPADSGHKPPTSAAPHPAKPPTTAPPPARAAHRETPSIPSLSPPGSAPPPTIVTGKQIGRAHV